MRRPHGYNHAVSENGVRYWLALIVNTLRRYVKPCRPIAMLRALVQTIATGYYGETCDDCGRAYVLWMSQPDLWRLVNDQTDAGLLCPACFDQRAAQLGVILIWTPRVFRHA